MENQKTETEAVARSQPPDEGSQKPEAGVQTSETKGQKPEVKAEPTEDAGEDAEMATTSEPVASNENAAPPAPDDEGYVWPEGTEAATEAAVQNGTAPEAVNAPLPSLDELVQRIPTEVRDTLDELFRVKFVSVKRASPSSLKS